MIYYNSGNVTLHLGKMQEELKQYADNSIDCCITDPPYELNFMGKGWDNKGTSFQKETWQEVYRVLKPGGYLLAFGGSRTQHRITCAIEDAGFEIRDTIMWLYGSGFPKSMNIGLAIDRHNGIESKIVGTARNSSSPLPANHNKTWEGGQKDGEYIKKQATNQWSGWGTCLKPAYEPIIVARKQLDGSCVENVMKYGVGGINIDECRVPTEESIEKGRNGRKEKSTFQSSQVNNNDRELSNQGRFPANIITDGSDEVAEGMPITNGNGNIRHNKNKETNSKRQAEGLSIYGAGFNNYDSCGYADSGSAMRYFYCAKASKKDRNEGLDEFEEKAKVFNGKSDTSSVEMKDVEKRFTTICKNIHPTVKPTELMQYLIKLVAPKGSTILDCFMGSGSTGKAIMYENQERDANYKFIGIEENEEYLPIAKARIINAGGIFNGTDN